MNARPTLLFDPTGHYGEAGHYYTVYFASLAAGFDPETAFRNAVFAQMPDEVNALDAVQQQISRFSAPGGMVSWTSAERDLIQRGLHSLTGESSTTERNVTRGALGEVTAGTMEFGFLLHRFGDAYAHSVRGDESRTYETGLGHFRHGHTPDQIHLRRELYASYVQDLFGTLSQRAGASGHSPRLSQQQVREFAAEVSSIRVMQTHTDFDTRSGEAIEYQTLDVEATETAQVQRIRELSGQLMSRSEFQESTVGPPTAEQSAQPPVGRMRTYAPEREDTMSWPEYQRTHPDFVSGSSWREVAGAVHSAASRVGQLRPSIYPLRPQ